MTPRLRLLLPAVVLLAAALPAQRDALDAEVRRALQDARPALLLHLRSAVLQPGMPGELALLCLAALHDGVPTDDEVLAVALERLAKADLQGTYDLALRLMVLEAHPDMPGRERLARADAKELLSHAHAGGFHYGRSSNWDLSNSQYGALGLRAAISLGIKVPRSVWTRLCDEVLKAQRDDGSFGYTPGNGAGTASMTAAGIAVLQVCKQNLAEGSRPPAAIDRAVAKAWLWFDKQKRRVGDPTENHCYYFHYGLERAGILSDVTAVGGQDWYQKGARMLLDAQGNGGGWTSATDFTGGIPGRESGGKQGQSVPTAFAILFLARRFQKIAGPLTGPSTITLPMLTAQSTDNDVQNCAGYLGRRGKEVLPDVLKALRDDVPARRRAAALALKQLTGQDFGFDPARGQDANAAALRAAELWYLKNR